jgi:hypothetical protein
LALSHHSNQRILQKIEKSIAQMKSPQLQAVQNVFEERESRYSACAATG